MRTNVYKDKIIKLLNKNHLMSILDIHKKISDADYSTVYRNVEQLVADGELKKIVFDKDKVMYEADNGKNRHDHFVCNGCGSVDEIDHSFSDSKFLEKYNVTDILVKGFCKSCN
jgi:Fe2+ or Zn2+ uptake regulation protein